MQGVVEASTGSSTHGFDASEIRRRYGSAFRPKPWIYWTDMLGSAAIGWTAFGAAASEPLGSPAFVVFLFIAIFAHLRSVLFIHELTHLPPGAVPGFEVGWHIAVGAPLQVPSLMYVGSHNDHHKRSGFGTKEDPEYAPLARYSRWRLVAFVLNVAFVPLVLPLRWGVLAPLSYVCPPLRKLVVERLSTLGINPEYRRPMPKGSAAARWMRQEMALAAVFWLAVAGWFLGIIGFQLWLTWVLMTSGILLINQVRTLAAHRYERDGSACGTLDQVLDSINLRGIPILTALVAPVGLRYHALHHFLPAVPYHSLGTLHRRLVRELPQEAPYHATEAEGVLAAVKHLWVKAPA